MGKKTERLFMSVLLFFQIILFIVIIVFAFSVTQNTSKQSQNMLNSQALNISEEHMRERVENIISYIEGEEEKVLTQVSTLGMIIYENLHTVEEARLEHFLDMWIPRIAAMEYGELIQLILHDKHSDTFTFYFQGDTHPNDYNATSQEILTYIEQCPYKKEISYETKSLYVISSEKRIIESVKDAIYDIIHRSIYGEDGYVWVNEILNYEGGKDYAIRLIHPNLKDTEGILLSTDMPDAKGNYPYLKELEGINRDGELFHTYYFKNKSNDDICEKASYAKLYKPFNWIIATGDPMDDVLVFSTELEKENRISLYSSLLNTILILIVIFILDIIIIFFNNQKFKERIKLEEKLADNEIIIQQADYESMTGLLRKVPGEKKIRNYIMNSSHKGGVLIGLDLDDLKGINDTLGHQIGDEAIIGISTTLKAHFRQTDILIRSGGDEFIVFLPEIGENIEAVDKSMEALIHKLSLISIGNEKKRNIHCSAGCSILTPDDTYEDLYNRADKALYHVKRNGKNNYAFYVPEMEEEDFVFRSKKLVSSQELHTLSHQELKHLLNSIFDLYNIVISANISRDTYYIVKDIGENLTNFQHYENFSSFIESISTMVFPSQKASFLSIFKYEKLLELQGNGKLRFSHYYKFIDKDTYRDAECNLIFYTNSSGDFCAYVLSHWLPEA